MAKRPGGSEPAAAPRTERSGAAEGRGALVAGALAAAVLALSALAETTTHEIHGLNGSWERYPTLSPGLGNTPQSGGPPAPAPVPDPPLKADYLEAWKAQRALIAKMTEEGTPLASNASECLPEGMPAMMQGIFPMEVLETPGQVTIIQEAWNQVRRVVLGAELPAPEDAEPRFAGHSSGRWEGDTLVVETVGIKENAQFRNVPHSAKMRISERIGLVGDGNYLEDKVTVTDPEYLTGPWSWSFMFKRWPGYEIQEYVCEDNRYGVNPDNGAQQLHIR